jgi:hypothetical protein
MLNSNSAILRTVERLDLTVKDIAQPHGHLQALDGQIVDDIAILII